MRRAYDALVSGLAGIAGLIIAAVAAIIVYDVAARNLGWQPPASTIALTEYALLYFTMAAAPWLVRMRGHIVVEIVYQKLGPRLRRYLDRVIPGLCALISFLVAVLAGLLIAESAMRGEIEVRSMDVPRWILFLPLLVGFALMGTEFLRLLIRNESVFTRASERGDSL